MDWWKEVSKMCLNFTVLGKGRFSMKILLSVALFFRAFRVRPGPPDPREDRLILCLTRHGGLSIISAERSRIAIASEN